MAKNIIDKRRFQIVSRNRTLSLVVSAIFAGLGIATGSAGLAILGFLLPLGVGTYIDRDVAFRAYAETTTRFFEVFVNGTKTFYGTKEKVRVQVTDTLNGGTKWVDHT